MTPQLPGSLRWMWAFSCSIAECYRFMTIPPATRNLLTGTSLDGVVHGLIRISGINMEKLWQSLTFMSGLLSNANIREAKTPMILACQIECHRPLQKLITNPENEQKPLWQIKNEAWIPKMLIYIYIIYIYMQIQKCMYIHNHIYIFTRTNKNSTYLEVDVKTLLIRIF